MEKISRLSSKYTSGLPPFWKGK